MTVETEFYMRALRQGVRDFECESEDVPPSQPARKKEGENHLGGGKCMRGEKEGKGKVLRRWVIFRILLGSINRLK